jgi:glycosyltransferase involved in cell wall biosynthesis
MCRRDRDRSIAAVLDRGRDDVFVRILNIICALDSSHGGPAEGALRLADMLRGEGHIVDFATLEHPEAPCMKELGESVFALGPLGAPGRAEGPLSFRERFAYSPDYVPWLRANVHNYDAVLVHALWNYSTLAARRVLVNSGVPYFVFPHGCLDPWFKQAYPRKDLLKRVIWPLSEGALMNNAAVVLFTTEEERVLAQGAFWPYRIQAAVTGFGASDVSGDAAEQTLAFRAAVPALEKRRYLLFLSRIHPKKGCDLLIDAFTKHAGEHADLDLVMAGPDQTGWREELEAQAERLGIGDRVHWTGMIEGDVKWGAFHGAEAFVLPSHSENFGIVVAEALACSTVALISDKVNLWREVADAGAGLVEPDTAEGAERLLARFLALGASERASMRAAARRCYEDNFKWEDIARRILKLIEGAVAHVPA